MHAGKYVRASVKRYTDVVLRQAHRWTRMKAVAEETFPDTIHTVRKPAATLRAIAHNSRRRWGYQFLIRLLSRWYRLGRRSR